MSRSRRWLWTGAQIFIVVAVLAALRAWQLRDVTRGGPAPEISGVLLDGGSVSLAAMRGEPVLVHFWASWCPVCRIEQGSIDALARDYRVLSVSLDDGTDAELRAYLAAQSVNYPVVVDRGGTLAQAYGVRGVPASFIVDAQGDIRFVEVGYTTGLGLRARLWWADS